MKAPGMLYDLRSCAQHLLGMTRDEISDMPPLEVAEIVYELQVHQLELQMQNEELARVQYELQESRQKYRDLYEFAPIGYLTLDKVGTIVDANFQSKSWLERKPGSLVGANFMDFILPEYRDAYLAHYQGVFSGIGRQKAQFGISRDESLFVLAHSQANIPEDGYCCTTLTDVTDLRQGIGNPL